MTSIWHILLAHTIIQSEAYAPGGSIGEADIYNFKGYPATMRRSTKVGSMLGQRRRRWPNTEPIFGERPVFAG